MGTLEATIPRSANGVTLDGLALNDDHQGRPVVKSVPPNSKNLLLGDIILAVDGTPVFSTTEIFSELRRSAATGHNTTSDELRLKICRLEQTVQPTTWSTSSLTVAAGRRLDIPLMVEEPSLGEYSFRCADSSGYIDFSLDFSRDGQDRGRTADPLVPSFGPCARGEGTFRVPAAGVVFARVDNSSAVFSSASLSCHVRLTPIAQIIDAETAALADVIREHHSHLEMLAAHDAGLAAQEAEHLRHLESLRVARAATARVRADDGDVVERLEAAADALDAAARALDDRRADPAQLTVEAVAEGRRVAAMALRARRTVGERSAEAEREIAAEEGE